MREQEPHPLSQPRLQRIQTLDQANKGAGTVVRRKDRLGVLASHRVVWIVFDSPSEESPVHIEQRCIARHAIGQQQQWQQ